MMLFIPQNVRLLSQFVSQQTGMILPRTVTSEHIVTVVVIECIHYICYLEIRNPVDFQPVC